ncbi:hypothetical protein [Dipodfec virus UOA04_Rod_781]|nr:hypothetical protein [Dipodfec virus UOA04_Rod_781]
MENELFLFRHYFIKDEKAGEIHYCPYVGSPAGVVAFEDNLRKSYPGLEDCIAYTDVFTYNPYVIGKLCLLKDEKSDSEVV